MEGWLGQYSEWFVLCRAGYDYISLTHNLLYNAPTHPDSSPTLFVSFDTVSNNLPNTNPTAQRFTPVPYDLLYCM